VGVVNSIRMLGLAKILALTVLPLLQNLRYLEQHQLKELPYKMDSSSTQLFSIQDSSHLPYNDDRSIKGWN